MVKSRVISPLIWVIIMVTLLIAPLISTHEPLSRGSLGDYVGIRRVSSDSEGFI